MPFYVCLPGPTVDWTVADGLEEIPIEERSAHEVTEIWGKTAAGVLESVQIIPDGVTARNFAFDVTPARYVTGLITERGICPASEAGLLRFWPLGDGSLG